MFSDAVKFPAPQRQKAAQKPRLVLNVERREPSFSSELGEAELPKAQDLQAWEQRLMAKERRLAELEAELQRREGYITSNENELVTRALELAQLEDQLDELASNYRELNRRERSA